MTSADFSVISTRDYRDLPCMEFVRLGNDKFEQVKGLMHFFPSQLLNQTERFFGCPDCADGGGLFI